MIPAFMPVTSALLTRGDACFLFQGETDVVTMTPLAEEHFQEVEAPTKGGWR